MKIVKFRTPYFRSGSNIFSHWGYWGRIDIHNQSSPDTFKSPMHSSHCFFGEDQQFSGLTDIKGIELWEGDICANDAAKWEIIFNTGCFCAKMIGGKDHEMHLALRGVKGLVKIGNIVENPELLKL